MAELLYAGRADPPLLSVLVNVSTPVGKNIMASPKSKSAPVAAEPQLLGIDSIPFETLQAEMAKRIADKKLADERAEAERVAGLKANHKAFIDAYRTSVGALEAFEAQLSFDDRVILGLKVSVERAPKGATEKALSAYVATLLPGSSFTVASLIESGVLDCSPSTARNALKALDIRPNTHGKLVRYFVPGRLPALIEGDGSDGGGTGTPEPDPEPSPSEPGTGKPTDEEPPAEPN